MKPKVNLLARSLVFASANATVKSAYEEYVTTKRSPEQGRQIGAGPCLGPNLLSSSVVLINRRHQPDDATGLYQTKCDQTNPPNYFFMSFITNFKSVSYLDSGPLKQPGTSVLRLPDHCANHAKTAAQLPRTSLQTISTSLKCEKLAFSCIVPVL